MNSQWIHAFAEMQDKLIVGAEEKMIFCPSCGLHNLQLSYVAQPATRVGYACLWCNTCLQGIWLSRVKVPLGVEFTSLDEAPEEIAKLIPKFTLIYD